MYFLKYKEQDLPVIVDFAVIKNVCSKLNLKLSDFESTINNPEQTELIAFEGLKRGHKLEGVEFNLTEPDVENILSENYGTFLQIFSECVLKMFTPQGQSGNKKK